MTLILGIMAAMAFLPSSAQATTAIQSCGDCHGQWGTLGTPNVIVDAATTAPGNVGNDATLGRYPGSHGTHAGPWYTNMDSRYNMRCEVCHVSPIWNTYNHQTGMVNINIRWISLNGSNQMQDGSTTGWGSYSKWTSFQNTNAFNPGYCTNTYCHSNGTAVATSVIPANTSPMWGTNPQITPTCVPCHGSETGNPRTGAPWYTNTKANSHRSHAWQTVGSWTGSIQGPVCYRCHGATAMQGTPGSTGNLISSVGNHIKKSYTLSASNGVSFTYAFTTTGGTCNNANCHVTPGGGNITKKWGSNAAVHTCVKCHGVPWATSGTFAADLNVAAPGYWMTGINTWGSTGTYTNGVSNAARVWAHNSHLNSPTVKGYTTVRGVECNDCHDINAYTASVWSSNHMNGVTDFVWSTLVTQRGGASNPDWGTLTLNPWYSSGNQACGNIYCHGQGLTSGGNWLTGIAPATGWQSLRFSNNQWLTQASAKDGVSCNQCHMSPPTRTQLFDHIGNGITSVNVSCATCHQHEGSGSSHIDGILYGAGACNACHWYDTNEAGAWSTNVNNTLAKTYDNQGGKLWNSMNAWGAHAKHINHFKVRFNSGNWLSANSDKWGTSGSGASAQPYVAVCGVCHTQDTSNHMNTAARQVNFNLSTVRMFGTAVPSWNTLAANRNCSNLDCHFKPTPAW